MSNNGMLVVDCDLRRGLHAKRWFDSVGHYSRQDVFGSGSGSAAAGHSFASPVVEDPQGSPRSGDGLP